MQLICKNISLKGMRLFCREWKWRVKLLFVHCFYQTLSIYISFMFDTFWCSENYNILADLWCLLNFSVAGNNRGWLSISRKCDKAAFFLYRWSSPKYGKTGNWIPLHNLFSIRFKFQYYTGETYKQSMFVFDKFLEWQAIPHQRGMVFTK